MTIDWKNFGWTKLASALVLALVAVNGVYHVLGDGTVNQVLAVLATLGLALHPAAVPLTGQPPRPGGAP